MPIMAISITWADAADNTGGTVTIAGADNALVTVYAQAVDAAGLRSPTFLSVGTRTGNGTVVITPTPGTTPGYLWLYAQGLVSGSAAVSNLVYALASDSSTALIQRCVDAIAARLAGLTMAASNSGGSAPNDRIFKVLYPAPDGLFTYPCIILSHEGVAEEQPGTLTNRDDIAYPVHVWVCDRKDTTEAGPRPAWLLWRQQVFRALRNQRLAGLTEVMTVEITPMNIVDSLLPAEAMTVLGFTAHVLCRETRGA